MPALEGAIIYGVQIRESANDGSDFSNAASDYRILFLGEDGLLHVKDSAGTVSSPYTGGSPGLTLLEQHTASSSATLNFTSFISSTYDCYVFECVNVIPATDNVSLYLRVSTDGGSTYEATNYFYALISLGYTGSQGNNQGNSVAQIAAFPNLDNAANTPGYSGRITLRNPTSTAVKKTFELQGSGQLDGGVFYTNHGAGMWGTTTAINAVRFLMSSGNIASGTIRVYGIAK